MNELWAISLFSGAGGFEQGFDRAGIRTVLQAENDPWCLEVLARHWPEVDRVDDVRSVDAALLQQFSDDFRGRRGGSVSDRDSAVARLNGRIREPSGRDIDLVYGGFPCQDVSVAGNRAGLRGDRSGLFYEFARVVRDLRPRWFAAENVPGLLSSADGADFGTVLGILVELGYGVAWRILDGRWFGVPQRRRRVLVVGCLGDPSRAAQVLAVCESCGGHPAPRGATREAVAASLRSRSSNAGVHMPGRRGEDDDNLVLAGTIGSHYDNVRADQAWTGQVLPTLSPGAHPGGLTGREAENGALVIANGLRASYGHHGHGSPRGDGGDNLISFDWMAGRTERTRTVSPADYARSNSTRNHTAISGGMGVRRLTPLECERLMGWPDEHTRYTADGREIADSHRYRMCGNGVIATVAEWLGHRLVQAERFRVAA